MCNIQFSPSDSHRDCINEVLISECPSLPPPLSVNDLMLLLCLHFTNITSFPSLDVTPTPLPARRFKKRTSSAPKTAAMATASRATVTTTPPTEVIQRVSSGWQEFSHLRSNMCTYTALICRHSVFVITSRTMQNFWCGSVTCNFLNLEMCKVLTLRCCWLA